MSLIFQTLPNKKRASLLDCKTWYPSSSYECKETMLAALKPTRVWRLELGLFTATLTASRRSLWSLPNHMSRRRRRISASTGWRTLKRTSHGEALQAFDDWLELSFSFKNLLVSTLSRVEPFQSYFVRYVRTQLASNICPLKVRASRSTVPLHSYV